MNSLPFILTIIAGLSTLLGALFIFIKCDINKLTKCSLAFASGVMISVSLFDLIPESLSFLLKNNIKDTSFIYLIRCIIIGIIFSVLIDRLLPENKNIVNHKLYRVGVFSVIAIIIHNIPEGIITYLSAEQSIILGLSITIAIAFHNIPEGISISVPIYGATKSKKKAILYTLLSGISEPIGALLALFFLKNNIDNNIMGFILAITSGIMIHIAIFKLLITSLQYKDIKGTFKYFILGFIFMLLNHIFLN